MTEQIEKKRVRDQSRDYSLEECPLPTLQINMENCTVIDSNIEAVKLIGWEKNELLDRPIKDLVMLDSAEDWPDLFASLMECTLLCFVKSRFNGILAARISTRTKEYSNKKVHFLELTEVGNMGNVAYGIVQADLVMQVSSRQKL